MGIIIQMSVGGPLSTGGKSSVPSVTRSFEFTGEGQLCLSGTDAVATAVKNALIGSRAETI
ncbi:hypothetical protein P9139_06605 [Curtobacterium flaccumfaciens]|nr:hypothetical protein P9139_06605 [Curtobacterium flaccumfaciens]